MYVIRKKFSFSAAHQLKGLPPEHPCSRLHGHNYKVEVVLMSERLNDTSFVRDYNELNRFKEWIDTKLDHRNLNDIFEVTTAEILAKIFFDHCVSRWPETYMVRVSETPKTWAEYFNVL